MKPSVSGTRREPSTAVTRPSSTVTARLHVSGQSRGQTESNTGMSHPVDQHQRTGKLGARTFVVFRDIACSPTRPAPGGDGPSAEGSGPQAGPSAEGSGPQAGAP